VILVPEHQCPIYPEYSALWITAKEMPSPALPVAQFGRLWVNFARIGICLRRRWAAQSGAHAAVNSTNSGAIQIRISCGAQIFVAVDMQRLLHKVANELHHRGVISNATVYQPEGGSPQNETRISPTASPAAA
jgi:hypothetical protein